MERREDAGVRALVATTLRDLGVLAAFTERTGGVSAPPYHTLNLGFHTGDRTEPVAENRRRAIGALDVPPFAAARQVHGTDVATVEPSERGAGFQADGALGPADILVTREREVPVALLVADCVPLVLAHRSKALVATVHAGWRGLAGGIVGRALDLFDPVPGAAAIGPAIGPCHYEVGEEVAQAVAGASPAGARTERRHGRLYLDLPGTVEAWLRRAGVKRIESSSLCTACHEDRFFSHRRDGTTGRQAAVAMLL